MHNNLTEWNNPSNANCCSPTQEILRYNVLFISFREYSNADESNPQPPFLILRNILIIFSHIDLQMVFGSKRNTNASCLPRQPRLWLHYPPDSIIATVFVISVLGHFLLPSPTSTIPRFSNSNCSPKYPAFEMLCSVQNIKRTITV